MPRFKTPSGEVTDEDLQERDKHFRGAPPRSLLTRSSRMEIVEEWDERIGDWRKKIAFTRRIFSDKELGIFLEEYAKWGRIGEAAAAIGGTAEQIRKVVKSDPEFEQMFILAEETYKDKLIAHHQNLLFNGTMKRVYDKEGNVIAEEQIFPLRLIELELKKHDAGYRDKQEIDLKVSGGVLIAPKEVKSIEDWEANFAATAKDVTPKDPE